LTAHPRILLVEDNELEIELATLAFAEHGYDNHVVVVRDGQEALDYLTREGEHASPASHLPDLILLDLNMPRLGGHEVLARLKSHPNLRALPVVIFTTSDEERDRRLCEAHGADGYTRKPYDFDGFVSTVGQLTRTYLAS